MDMLSLFPLEFLARHPPRKHPVRSALQGKDVTVGKKLHNSIVLKEEDEGVKKATTATTAAAVPLARKGMPHRA